jgi:hypothetical protein
MICVKTQFMMLCHDARHAQRQDRRFSSLSLTLLNFSMPKMAVLSSRLADTLLSVVLALSLDALQSVEFA